MHDLTPFAIAYFAFGWALRLWFVFYIPRRRHPSSAIAWLLVVFLVPEIGITLFFLIGKSKLSKRRREKQRYVDHLIASATPVPEERLKLLNTKDRARYEPLVRLGQKLGRLPLSLGNSVDIFPYYNKAIQEITTAIDRAQEFVHVEYFILALDDTTQPLFDALGRAVNRGVAVRVLFDAVGARKYPKFRRMKKELTRMGAQWYAMLPIKLGKEYNRPDLRNHRKIVVIDDQIAYMGSQNMIDRTYHRKDDIVYDELVVKLTGPVVRQCNTLFAADWYAESDEELRDLIDPKKREMPQSTGGVSAQVIPSGPGYESMSNLQLFAQLLYQAKKRVVISSPYFVPDESLLIACKSAAQRGVEVILINSEAMDQYGVGYAQRSFYEDLLAVGVKIYLYRAPYLLHSKYLTIDDDIAVIGSSNMDIRSFELNLECVVVLYDPDVVAKLKKQQNKDLKRCSQIDLGQWHQRPLYQKMFESIARLTSALQ